MLNSWLLLIINGWIILWNKAVFCLEVLIYKRLQMWRHSDVISRSKYLILHCQNLPFLMYILCNFCLNLHIAHGDMKENVSGCFFLNTVYKAMHRDGIVFRAYLRQKWTDLRQTKTKMIIGPHCTYRRIHLSGNDPLSWWYFWWEMRETRCLHFRSQWPWLLDLKFAP